MKHNVKLHFRRPRNIKLVSLIMTLFWNKPPVSRPTKRLTSSIILVPLQLCEQGIIKVMFVSLHLNQYKYIWFEILKIAEIHYYYILWTGLKIYYWPNSSKYIVKQTPYCYKIHNLTIIDTVCQLRNSFRNISGHSKNPFPYLTR